MPSLLCKLFATAADTKANPVGMSSLKLNALSLSTALRATVNVTSSPGFTFVLSDVTLNVVVAANAIVGNIVNSMTHASTSPKNLFFIRLTSVNRINKLHKN